MELNLEIHTQTELMALCMAYDSADQETKRRVRELLDITETSRILLTEDRRWQQSDR